MRKRIIIVGAGISAAPPSNLPDWWGYNITLVNQIKRKVLEMYPETSRVLECIDVSKKLPVQCISEVIVEQGAGESYFPLLQLLDGTRPNANHFALATLAYRGELSAIITTNFDTLIENAFRQKGTPLFCSVQESEYYEALYVNCCRLFKIHGSVHDQTSLIDTIRQKATGLSVAKSQILENVFLNSDIYVIGFSGADLDFDLNYIPLKKALESGSSLTWILREKQKPNSNVTELHNLYPRNVFIKNMELSDFFEELGVDYSLMEIPLEEESDADRTADLLENKIIETLSMWHIGVNGCMGYCISFLEMMGEEEAVAKLVECYEKKIDWSNLDLFSISGLYAVARYKIKNKKFDESLHFYFAIYECLTKIHELNCELYEKNNDQTDNQKIQKEYLTNMVSVLNNIANVYYYKTLIEQKEETLIKAREFLGKAEDILEKYPDISGHSLVKFNLARVNYMLNNDEDIYLESLRQSEKYAKQEGRLETLTEILLEECSARMKLGEYPLADKALQEARKALMNVGNIYLKRRCEKLTSEYYNRKGKGISKEQIASYLSITSDLLRKGLILYEAKGEKNKLVKIYIGLCERYIKNEKWKRLRELAECFCMIADSDESRSHSWYFLGCAEEELKNYPKAKEYFNKIISLGEKADADKLKWAYIELARINTLEKEASSIINSNFETVLTDESDIYNQPAEVIATQANRLYDAGNYEKAWELMKSAIEKNRQSSNRAGIARCENNMAIWCLVEHKYEEAVEHSKRAMKIKISLGDVAGGAQELSHILNIYINYNEKEKVKKFIEYAKANIPLFEETKESGRLFYYLCQYELLENNYADALMYAQKAKPWVRSLNDSYNEEKNNFMDMLQMLQGLFRDHSEVNQLPEFDTLLDEGIQLYKNGKYEESIRFLNKLKKCYPEDYMKVGRIYGTLANASLYCEKYPESIKFFKSALEKFEIAEKIQKQDAGEYRITILNGIGIALSNLDNKEEAIRLYKKELDRNKLSPENKVMLTVNLCNRVIVAHLETIKKNDTIFDEVLQLLNNCECEHLDHESLGGLQCCYGLLYRAVSDEKQAKQYYLNARKEFLVVNSDKLSLVNEILQSF